MGACMSASVCGGACMSTSVCAGDGDVAHDGPYIFKIDGYSWTKGAPNGTFIKSEPFGIGGHLWRIAYYPDGYLTEDAGWISLYLYLSRKKSKGGEVEASYKLSLLDDQGEAVPKYCFSDGVTRTFSNSPTAGWGSKKFITRKALEKSTYLNKDGDCFRVRCDVSVSTPSTKIRANTKQGGAASQFLVTVPPSDMKQHMGRLLSSGAGADVAFQVGGETFAAHRLVLGARSSVFLAELLGPTVKESHVVQIADMEPRVFEAMLHFIYTDELEFAQMDFAMAQRLLVAADRYGLERLKLMCEHKLCECVSASTATTTLVLAEQHGCRGLREACLRFLESPGHLKKIIDSGDEFQHLTSSCPSLLDEQLPLLANVAR